MLYQLPNFKPSIPERLRVDTVIYPGIHTGNEPRLFLYVPRFVKSLSLSVPALSPEHRRHWQIMARWWTTLSLHGFPFGRVTHRLTARRSILLLPLSAQGVNRPTSTLNQHYHPNKAYFGEPTRTRQSMIANTRTACSFCSSSRIPNAYACV